MRLARDFFIYEEKANVNIVKKLNFNRIQYAIFIFVTIITVFLLIVISPQRISGDFDVYYHASQFFLAKSPMYIPHHGIEEFKYLPLFALAFAPLAMLKETTALGLWSILNIILFYFMFYLLYKLKQISFTGIRDFLIVVCLFALTGRYLFDNIRIGQVNILLCFFMLLAMYLAINRKDFWSGSVLALSLMIKLFPLLLLFYFFLTGRFKIVAYTFFMGAFFLLVPAIYCGVDLNFKYLQQWYFLLKSSPAVLFYSVKNCSLLAFFSWFFIARHEPYYIFDYGLITKTLTPEVYYVWLGSCFIFFSLFFYDVFFVKGKDLTIRYLDYSCLFVCSLLFNPLAYLNALIVLVVPYCFILRFLFYSPSGAKYKWTVGFLTLLGFILLQIDNRFFFRDTWIFYVVLESKPLMWTVIIVYFSLLLIKKSDQKGMLV